MLWKAHFILMGLFFFSSQPSLARMVEQEENYTIYQKQLSIEVDFDGGELIVLPSHSRRDCHVILNYPRGKCTVDVRYNEKRGHLDIVIDNEKWTFEGDGEKAPQLILELPHSPEISLAAHIKAGETNFELGGLRIRDFELRNWAGETTVNFSEPNKMIMETLYVNVKVGQVELLNLGNARFEDADINSGIGELHIDFHGQGIREATANIDLDIGETRIDLPTDVAAKLRVTKFLFLSDVRYPNWFEKRGQYYFSQNYDESDKQLTLYISTGIGELAIRVD